MSSDKRGGLRDERALTGPAVPQLVVLEEFDHDLTLPTDDTPLLSVLLPLLIVLLVFGALLVISATVPGTQGNDLVSVTAQER